MPAPTPPWRPSSRVSKTPTLSHRRQNKNPALASKIAQMSIPLRPLVSLADGSPHPAFPYTILNYWLLTASQLDDLAHFYHQRTPSEHTYRYPCPVLWRTDASLEEKRRRIGRFIGLRGCDSPAVTEETIREEIRRARFKAEEDEMFNKKRGY
ncbi:beta-xylosidase [Amylocarpus encephaloides]|uniref:Beta-xylosidase n=1 Tax=Amylocarpus encephaloides TaxID=45428 RepID=A0A9P7Y9K3_9HELO|nr:beta-xylosidase [Amylocarpus encephaloides]